MTNKRILAKIINAANLSKKDVVLEIGPGTGILTLELAKYAKKVIAVEKDKRLCEMLNARNAGNVRIINADILDYKLQAISYKLIANLPYYITSPVIRKFLETDKPPQLMVLMVQKEVAQRIVAKPPHMNLLAIAVQFYARPEIISYVSKESFWPVPKVDSAIIKIVPRPIPEIDTKKFFELVKKGFSSKRKMLKNNLGRDIGSNARAQELSIEQWLNLYKML